MASQTRSVDNTVSSEWADPNNAFSDDGNCTSTDSDGAANVYNMIGTPFAIPSGATIDGIEVVTQRGGDGDDAYSIEVYDADSQWRLQSGTAGSAANCSTAANETLGNSADTWSGTWTATHINSSSFQIRLTFVKSKKANVFYVDHISVVVYYTSAADLSVKVAASEDDGSFEEDAAPQYSYTRTDGFVGSYDDGTQWDQHCCFRFLNVTIPKDATINDATFKPYVNSGGVVGDAVTKVYGIKEADTSDFSSDPFSRTHTDASVDWDNAVDPFVADQYNSKDITSVIQEIVNQGGWASGNALGIFWENDGGTGINYVQVRTYDGDGSTKAAQLIVNYTAVAGWTSLQFVSEPPTASAWNKLKYEGGSATPSVWNKLLYTGE